MMTKDEYDDEMTVGSRYGPLFNFFKERSNLFGHLGHLGHLGHAHHAQHPNNAGHTGH